MHPSCCCSTPAAAPPRRCATRCMWRWSVAPCRCCTAASSWPGTQRSRVRQRWSARQPHAPAPRCPACRPRWAAPGSLHTRGSDTAALQAGAAALGRSPMLQCWSSSSTAACRSRHHPATLHPKRWRLRQLALCTEAPTAGPLPRCCSAPRRPCHLSVVLRLQSCSPAALLPPWLQHHGQEISRAQQQRRRLCRRRRQQLPQRCPFRNAPRQALLAWMLPTSSPPAGLAAQAWRVAVLVAAPAALQRQARPKLKSPWPQPACPAWRHGTLAAASCSFRHRRRLSPRTLPLQQRPCRRCRRQSCPPARQALHRQCRPCRPSQRWGCRCWCPSPPAQQQVTWPCCSRRSSCCGCRWRSFRRMCKPCTCCPTLQPCPCCLATRHSACSSSASRRSHSLSSRAPSLPHQRQTCSRAMLRRLRLPNSQRLPAAPMPRLRSVVLRLRRRSLAASWSLTVPRSSSMRGGMLRRPSMS